ncbi:MAG: ribosome biogenesis/translation initiation ATPase RLI [Candidatus ainarchaeum sp.]|nr:ribosome biogenesis/translation initiation ATPase RLI [Candidatus ainarchaeum sp.]
MAKRIAVIDRTRCTKASCGYQCIRVCPVNRMGKECIKQDDEGFPVISEALCTGCGICPKKCPVKCLTIINLLEEAGKLVHQYGPNSFRLYNIPLPKTGAVVGLIGANGVGKTTAMQILAGRIKPNLGDYGHAAGWEKIAGEFKGQEVRNYFQALAEKKARISLKPQNVDQIPDVFRGKVGALLKKADERKRLSEAAEAFGITGILSRDVAKLSGGELQRVAICAAYLRDADVYCFDEPSSYLDVKQRMRIAGKLKSLASEERKSVMVVEHDLAVLDYLSDYVNVFFGVKGAYGVVSGLKGARNGVNEYLDGFLKDENLRIRDYPIKFGVSAEAERRTLPFFSYPALGKDYADFSLECAAGEVRKGEIIGVLGENAIGKTTFVKLLAGIEKPDSGEAPQKLSVSYKPQYVKSGFKGTVAELVDGAGIRRDVFDSEVRAKLEVDELMEKDVRHLSGGELQRTAIAIALSKDADLYLLDEPSAFLDVEQRLNFAGALKQIVEGSGRTAFVVDHDVVLVDAVSSRVCVFGGEPAVRGLAGAPEDKRGGMNRFLKGIDVTLRRDKDSKRPRVNKPGSQMDREQKESGEYYYSRAEG